MQLLSQYSQITNTHFKVHELYDTSISTWRKTYTTIELNWFQIPIEIVWTMLVSNDLSPGGRVVETFIISSVFPCLIVKNYSIKVALMALLMQFHWVSWTIFNIKSACGLLMIKNNNKNHTQNQTLNVSRMHLIYALSLKIKCHLNFWI